MGLFKSKTPSVPAIPTNTPTQNLPELPAKPELPQPTFSQPTQPTLPKPTLPQPTQATFPKPMQPQVPETTFPNPTQTAIPTVTAELTNKETTSKEQPFFIRIDKFNETKDNFEQINIKVTEMERVLQNLEQTKDEEEREINAWKQDITEMKNLITQIDKEIFNKI